jgi:hypothetical protein
MTTIEFSNIIATLVINGFHINHVDRFPSDNSIINTYKYDKLGAEIRYSILFSEDKTETAILTTLTKIAKNYGSKPLLISDYLTTSDITIYSVKQFFDFFGGIVNTGLILIPNLSDILDILGHNKLPSGLVGDPDNLLELYTSECFQFIFESPTRRYGSDRLFTKLPDGIILCKNKFMILFDSKAYKDGFDISSDDINRFAFYVNDFNNRYANYFGYIFSFVIVSGHFNASEKSISNRSAELYQLCNCKISTINCKELGNIVQLTQSYPDIKGSIDWKNIFSNVIIESKYVQQEINRINKDKIY